MRLVMLGPPGAGKGTQSVRLAMRLGVPHVSTGDMLRDAIRKGTPIGEAARTIEAGNLASDAVVMDLVSERIGAADASRGFVLDGFPRNVAQAEALTDSLRRKGMDLDAVIEVRVDEDALVERMENRVRHAVANGDEVRQDDNAAAFRVRLEIYRELTRPVSDYYRGLGTLRTVDGMTPMDEVFGSILACLT